MGLILDFRLVLLFENLTSINTFLSQVCFYFSLMKSCFILDHAMPIETVIVGDERGSFVFRCGNDSRNVYGRRGYIEAVALVFAQDRNRSSGTSRCLFVSSCHMIHCNSYNTTATVPGILLPPSHII